MQELGGIIVMSRVCIEGPRTYSRQEQQTLHHKAPNFGGPPNLKKSSFFTLILINTKNIGLMCAIVAIGLGWMIVAIRILYVKIVTIIGFTSNFVANLTLNIFSIIIVSATTS